MPQCLLYRFPSFSRFDILRLAASWLETVDIKLVVTAHFFFLGKAGDVNLISWNP